MATYPAATVCLMSNILFGFAFIAASLQTGWAFIESTLNFRSAPSSLSSSKGGYHAPLAGQQHVAVAKMTGVTEEEIEKIASEGTVTTLDEEGNLLCRVADEISRDVKLSDDALAQILNSYGNRGATELILCVSYFNMLSRFLESTRVRLEEESILENDSGPLTDHFKG